MAVLKTLRNNLIILAAIKDHDKLVAFRGRLLNKSSLLGRIVVWIHSLFKTPQKTDHVITRCKADLLQLIARMEKLYHRYIHHEIERLEKRPYSAKKRDAAEKEILQACTYFRPFFNEIRKKKPSYLCEKLVPQDGSWVAIAEAIRFVDEKHAYEHLTKKPLPLELFDLCVKEAKMTVRQKKALQDWVKTIRSVKNIRLKGFKGSYANHYATPRKLHRLLFELNERVLFFCQSQRVDKISGLQKLELKLFNSGLKELLEGDPKHLNWVESLKPGDSIPYKGGAFILDQEVTTEEEALLNRRLFSIREDPNNDFIAYKNGAGPYLEDVLEWEEHFGIPLPYIQSRDDELGIALREKIVDRVDQYEWQTGEFNSKVDIPQKNALMDLLSILCQLSYTPYPLKTSDFGFTSKGEMRALNPMELSAFSFERLEEFAYEAAQGNIRIFNDLMHYSGINQLKEANEYRLFCKKTFDGLVNKTLPPIPKKHPAIQARFLNLQKKIQQSFEIASKGISDQSGKKAIAEKLFQKYRRISFCSFLPEGYPEIVPDQWIQK